MAPDHTHTDHTQPLRSVATSQQTLTVTDSLSLRVLLVCVWACVLAYSRVISSLHGLCICWGTCLCDVTTVYMDRAFVKCWLASLTVGGVNADEPTFA